MLDVGTHVIARRSQDVTTPYSRSARAYDILHDELFDVRAEGDALHRLIHYAERGDSAGRRLRHRALART